VADKIIDSYLTLDSSGEHEIKIKGSRFIALGNPVGTESAAQAILDEVRKKEHAATHHCYAYQIGIGDEIFKYSDDGEPSGTAGRPIHQAITGRNLKNVLVIVVRYYGGTKLGTGGLTRAYSLAATEMLDSCKIVETLICDQLAFDIPFALYDRAMRLISRGEYKILSQDFADKVSMILEVRKSHTDEFISRLIELTGGKIEITKNS
jgi:uncharacterized YigZ family protein